MPKEGKFFKDCLERFEDLATHKDAWTRTHSPGHFTASAFVFCPASSSVLLLHHQKLGRWLQPGGHCDGNNMFAETALRELEEETGIRGHVAKSYFGASRFDVPFDLDIHSIPARKTEPQHLHFDARFLVLEDSRRSIPENSEGNRVKWWPLEELHQATQEESILRMVRVVRAV
jgi:8-oxo-dGTP pyrophosphatase MutT (NUDIX family)